MSNKVDEWFRDCFNEEVVRKKNGNYDRTSYDVYIAKERKRQAKSERKRNRVKKLSSKKVKSIPDKKICWVNSQFYGGLIVFLQIFPSPEAEGMVWWIIIVTVLVTVIIAVLRNVIGSIVAFFIVKKDETKDEVRKASMIFFVFLVGVILVFASSTVGIFLNKPASEIATVGVFVILISILFAGLNYRKGAKRTADRIRRKKTDKIDKD